MKTELTGVIADHFAAVNAFDTDAIAATFAPDAYVNDARRQIDGIDAIRRWIEKEMVGDRVTMDVIEVLDHYGDTSSEPATTAATTRPTCPTSW
jgi:ketosteroid isomerase-like protein